MTHDFHFSPSYLATAVFHPWTWRMAWRDSRSQRLRLIIFSLAIVSGITALVAIYSLKASVQRGIAAQAKSLLGSDLQISSRQPFSDGDLSKLAVMARKLSRETTFPTMLKFPNGGARLVQIRGVENDYPFYGSVETRPKDAWQKLSEDTGILLEPALLDQFEAKIGDEIEFGNLTLRILGVVEKPAPKVSRFSGFAPEAYVKFADIPRSGLLGNNSMSSHQVHLELANSPKSDLLKERVRADFPETPWRLETPEDRQENLGDALEKFQQFLGILAFVSLALGAIGVAGAVHAHINRRLQTVAILRCLGCPTHLAAAIYAVQAGVLGLLGALVGGRPWNCSTNWCAGVFP